LPAAFALVVTQAIQIDDERRWRVGADEEIDGFARPNSGQ
jgi:hypothetical protein